MGSGHPVPFRVLSGASARRPLCPRGSQLPRHPDQHHCVWTAGSVSPPDPRRSAPARSCVCLGHTPAPEQRQRIQERRTGRVDGRPEGRGWTGGGGSVTLGDLPRQRGGAPGGAEDGPPQGDPGQRPMRKSRWASWRRDPNPNPNPGLGWAGLGLAGAPPSGCWKVREFADRKRRDAHGWSPSSKTHIFPVPAGAPRPHAWCVTSR